MTPPAAGLVSSSVKNNDQEKLLNSFESAVTQTREVKQLTLLLFCVVVLVLISFHVLDILQWTKAMALAPAVPNVEAHALAV